MNLLAISVYSGLLSSLILSALMLYTVFSREFRFWPPGEKDRKWATYWFLATVNSVSILYLTVEGLESLNDISSLSGVFLASLGVFITLKAIKDLSLERTSGVEENFVKKGLYSYSRNPQVIGNLLTLAGVIIIAPSIHVSAVSALTGLWLVSMIFAEEDWLEEKYDENYLDYKAEVPRFL